jgi:hypothetical protein
VVLGDLIRSVDGRVMNFDEPPRARSWLNDLISWHRRCSVLCGHPSSCPTVGQEALPVKGDDWPPMDATKTQLINELGRPNNSALSVADGKSTETLTWVYAHAESNPALLIPVVGLFVTASGEGMAVNSRSLAVMFDADGKIVPRVWQQNHSGNPPPLSDEQRNRESH